MGPPEIESDKYVHACIDMGIPAFGVKHSDRLGIAFTMTLWPLNLEDGAKL